MPTPEEMALKELEEQIAQLKDNQPQEPPQQPEAKADGETELQDQPKTDPYLEKLEEMKKLLMEQQQQPREEPEQNQEPERDEVLDKLLRMTPQERADWAVKNGQAGVLKLLELQDVLYRKELEAVRMEAKTTAHDAIVDEWFSQNEDLFKDKELAAIANGIESQLLQDAGVRSYKELSQAQLRKHLTTVATRMKEIATKLGKLEEKKKEETALGAFRSVGDAAGTTAEVQSPVDVTKMSGFDLESLPLEKLQQLEQQLLQ